MTVPVLHETNHYGHKVIAPDLTEATIAEGVPTTTKPRQLYFKDGAIHYRTADNLERPIHENAIREIVDPDGIVEVEVDEDYKATIAIATADGTKPGLLSPDQYTQLQSAVPQSFVENLVQNALRDAIAGMDRKAQGVRVAVNTNTSLTSTFGTFDGVAIASTDPNKSILLFNQTNPAQNGAYNITASGLVRRADSDSAANLTNGATYQVEAGSYENHVFTLVTADGFAIDTDPLTFLDISGVNVLREGDGISIVNQRINAKTTVDRLIVNGDGNLDIAPNYEGQNSIKKVGVITEGIWNGSPLSLEYGGLGVTTYEGARSVLNIERTVFGDLGDGVATEFTFIHALYTLYPQVYGFLQLGDGSVVPVGIIDFDVVDQVTIRIRASFGGNPIGVNGLRIYIKAHYYNFGTTQVDPATGAVVGSGGS